MSDSRPPDDGPSWPERDLETGSSDEPAAGWSDDPYRYEPPPPFEPFTGPLEPLEPVEESHRFEPLDADDPPPFGAPPLELDADEPIFDAPPPIDEQPTETHDLPMEPDEPEPDEPAPDEPPLAVPDEPPLAVPDEPPLAVPDEPPLAVPDEPPLAVPDEPPLAVPDEPPLAAPDEPPFAAPDEPPLAAPDEPPEPSLEAAEPVTAFEGSANAWDPKQHGNRRRPTTAEQAVPWLIGVILALTGMVIVLLALIFTSPDGLMAGQLTGSPSPSASIAASAGAGGSGEPDPSASGSSSASAQASASSQPTPQQTATPNFGALEMVYLGRPSAVAPIYLLRRDFAKGKDPEILAQADQGVEKFAWSPDGQSGAAVISGRAVAIDPGSEARRLADNVTALTFGWDSQVVYGVRITKDGANDRAQVLEIDFVTGASHVLATVHYPHPVTAPDAPLREAQFIDDGGLVRIYAVADGHLALWVLGAPNTYRIDPADGTVTKITRQPTLWSPDGRHRIVLREDGNGTTLRLRDRNNQATAAVTIAGLVSHVRWAQTSNEIVFTLGRLSAGGGVRQDLYVWDLRDGKDPLPLTSSGAAFGADWRGVLANWAP